MVTSALGQGATDTIPPTITAIPSVQPNTNGWNRDNVRVRFLCADTGGSGIATFPPAQTVTTEGAGQVVSATVRDRAGNAATASLALNIDKTPPVVTAVRIPEAGPNGWVSVPVTVTFTAVDALSGVLAESVTPPITYSTDRNTTAIGRATDLAGNVGTVQLPGIKIDMTRPKITVALSPVQTGSGWYNAPVTAHFTSTDAGSGIASSPPDQLFSQEGRAQVVSGTAVDNVGLSSTVTATLNIDLTPPVVKATLSRPPDVNGWYTSPVTATFKCSDALSGVYDCPDPVVISSEGANQPINATALDRARNTARPAETVSLDLTPPSLNIQSPASNLEVQESTFTITGAASDVASGVAGVTINGAPVAIGSDGSFAIPVSLAEGSNSFVLAATDRVGRSSSRTVILTRTSPTPPPPPTQLNLFEDPTFESGVSGFYAQDASSSVSSSATSPLQGAKSLKVLITGYGNNVWWTRNFEGGLASHFLVRAHLRSDSNSQSSLQFCAMIYFADGGTTIACSSVDGSAGDKGVVTAELPVDPARRLQSINLRMYQEGSDPVAFTLDEAVAYLDVVEAPPAGGGGSTGGGNGGGGSGGGGGGENPPPPTGPSAYPGYTYNLPLTRPFISLASFTQANQSSVTYNRFRTAADQAVAGNPPYAYSAVSSVTMYRFTGNPVYINDAIARVEAFVAAAEQAIAQGGVPDIAGDSYLEIGWYLEQLSLAYDHGYDRLTPAQRTRWAAFAEQSLFNLWHPSQARWGGVLHTWSGWSVNDPGNNYHFHFLRATMLWALATQSSDWLTFLQTQKFPALVDYYVQLPGGGTREGTGYGTAIRSLFENFIFWKDSTGEDLGSLSPHVRETIDYWVHATVPTRDRFAPIGDQSRSSMPDIFDYHENLVHTAVMLSQGTPQAGRGTWWLNNNSINGVNYAFNLLDELLPLPDAPTEPTALVYHSTGAGAFFARTGWDTGASWFSFIAGKYDQSHAHQDQGSFTFFKGDWLAVTPNIYSHSGLMQEVEFHNGLRFERADSSIIHQVPSDTQASNLSYSESNGTVLVNADLSKAYWHDSSLVQSWTRQLQFSPHKLRVLDSYTVGQGVRAVFQLQVPVLPVAQADGSLVAGHLRIVPLQGVTYTVHSLPAEFSQGYRIDLVSTVGNSFAIELQAQ